MPGEPNVKVDVYSPKTKEVFEYLGCFSLGFPCIPNRHNPIDTSFGTLLTGYQETKLSLQKIKNLGYTVVSIWGCDLRKLARNSWPCK
jgi:G:T-mismatch repair DNA endonuclease (very short patch repair protein)